MRGRIQGSLTVVLLGGPHIANLLHGASASILDHRVVICAGGLLTTVTVAAITGALPELRNYTPGTTTSDPTENLGSYFHSVVHQA
ncbi:hypothetical protein [Nonomuraea basaltis]|uniref:hypothetical protein n=1 Tax=Nonomuraea basaltis TaxID=2495887 RepID=UPI00110C62FD|nr:hypothetical protein [Nonomuraea basaltis]TMR92612.1 hypothetical protein EJK15_43855 [Nonomuraea basaltis]